GAFAADAAALHLARRIAEADAKGEASTDAAASVAADVWPLIGLAPEQLGAIREEAELNLAAYLALFFPR
ncbi:MAG: HDOD domain-containing protein, partial [Thauera sp.]|nr:HDOD domain-containing protein [Thauera sp.]